MEFQKPNILNMVIGIIAIVCFLRLRAIWSGVILDISKDTFTYYGRGKSANSFFEYFLQYFGFNIF